MQPQPVSPRAWDARRLATATTFSELDTSKDDPAKDCGARSSYASLAKLTCDDGSRPFGTPREAARARAGSLGPGGICGHIIDLYEVPCPSGTLEVFLDMYWCPPGMSAF